MKISSISLIAAALAAIAGSVTAAPIPRPFGNDVDIYSRENIHQQAVRALLHASSCAKEVGLHEHAKTHEDDARVHQNHLQHGTHDPQHAYWSMEAAHHTTAHTKAFSLNRQAAHFARGYRSPDLAQVHERTANRNVELMLNHTPNLGFAETSQEIAHRTLVHGEAVSLNRKAAPLAREHGFLQLAQSHEDTANRIVGLMSSRLNPEFARTSKEIALQTLEHGEAASLNRNAAPLAREHGLPELAEFHEDIANQNVQLICGELNQEFARTSKARAHQTLEHGEAASLNRKAAPSAREHGLPELAKFHEDAANQNVEHMRNAPNSEFARTWKARAHQTLEHGEAASLNREAAHLARERGLPELANFHEDAANRNVQHMHDAPDREFARTSKAMAHQNIHRLLRPSEYFHN